MKRLLTTLALTLAAAVAAAQTFPSKPIKLVVPFSAGSGTDIVARTVGEAMAKGLGQPVVVENKPGAGGTLAAAAVARGEADGHTVLVPSSGHAVNPSIYPNLSYDTLKDLTGVTPLVAMPNVLVVSPARGWKSVADLVAAAKAKPGELNFSSGGNGTGAHLSGESLAGLSGVQMRHIPYKSVGASLIAVANGEVEFAFGNGALIWPLVQGRKLRVLAFSGDTRVPEYPDIPLVNETIKGFEYHDWAGFLAPAGTPPEIIARLQREIAAITADPAVAKQMRTAGLIPVASSPELFAKHIAAEGAKWSALARKINLKLD